MRLGKQGHKTHSNFLSYERYVNKFQENGNSYFIRFTVPVAKNETENKIHSSAISEVAICKKGENSYFVSAYNNAQSNVSISGSSEKFSSYIDTKLADFLGSVNKICVKVSRNKFN